MRMVDRQQLLAAISHRALRGKQIFGRGFVSDERIGRDIPQWIDGPGSSIIAANQAAAFARRLPSRVVEHFTEMRLRECEHTSGDYLAKGAKRNGSREEVLRGRVLPGGFASLCAFA